MPRKKTIQASADNSGIDRLIHEPARLNIMVHLKVVESGGFVYLKRETGMSWGNLSVQVSKLETAGYVVVQKEFTDKKPHTVVSLTEKGRKAFEKYQEQIRNILNSAKER